MYSDQRIAAAIILIMEASVGSLLFMPAGYAIALETLAPLISPLKKAKVNPSQKKVCCGKNTERRY
tara:strand:- start:520 stop:717 length:198 start_codon:yes stop_codon:yes gene_type:complete